ncbi:MAG: hypothetical protein M0Z28_20385 [Rhodospirillales bacterium]|nr:hypothetical protein [Rhodospirillales bacterium]
MQQSSISSAYDVNTTLAVVLERAVSAARKRLACELDDYLHAHLAGLTNKVSLRPLGVQATVGMGKTWAAAVMAAAAYRLGIPVAILVPTHNLVSEYVAAISKEGGAATAYHGRAAPDAGMPDHTCWRMGDIEAAGQRNHMPASSICRTCQHGVVAMLLHKSQEVRDHARTEVVKRGIDTAKVAACRFLSAGLPAQLAAQVIVAPIAAFSEAMTMWRDPTNPQAPAIRRLVIIDELASLGKIVPVSIKDCGVWLDKIAAVRSRLHSSDQVTRDALDAAEAAIRMLVSTINDQRPLDETLRVAWADAWTAANKAQAAIGGTARWERPVLDDDADTFFIPLRAMRAISHSLKAGVAVLSKRSLRVFEAAPAMAWALDRGFAIIMDATMPAHVRKLIELAGGHVHDAVVDQPLRVRRVIGCKYTRGNVGEGFERQMTACLNDYRAFSAEVGERGEEWALMVHKAHLIYPVVARPAAAEKTAIAEATAQAIEDENGARVGWWGRDEMGHNRWSGCHIALFGLPLLVPGDEGEGALADQWEVVRAAMLIGGDAAEAWPVLDGSVMRPHPQSVPVPGQAPVRAWLLDHYAAKIAQAAGRARALNQGGRTIEILIFGGVVGEGMDQALTRHGVRVDETISNRWHRDAVGRPRGAGSGPEAVQAAIQAVRALRGVVSVRTVAKALRAAGGTARNGEIRDAVRAAREAQERCAQMTIDISDSHLGTPEPRAEATPRAQVREDQIPHSETAKEIPQAPTMTEAEAEQAELEELWQRFVIAPTKAAVAAYAAGDVP